MTSFREIEALITARQKIAAIRDFRALTGVGLKDAKDAVENFEAHDCWPAEYHQHAAATVEAAPAAPELPRFPSGLLPTLEQLLRGGELITAIKELRAATGWGLKESKDAVDEYRAHGSWPASVIERLGGSSASPAVAPRASAVAPPAPPTPSRSTGTILQDPGSAAMLQALARSFGQAPHVQLSVEARRSGLAGHLVMLRDRCCFVREDHGQWSIDPIIAYDAVRHVEVAPGAPAVLYVSVAHFHERFELQGTDAEAALALFRVFAP